MKKILLVLVVLCGLFRLASFAEEASQKRGNLDYGYTYLNCSVENMPVDIRNVPIHPDDLFAGQGYGTVGATRFEMKHAFSVGLLYAREITFSGQQRPSVNLGIGLDWMIYPMVASGGDRQDSTYQGEGREIGSALTYVALRQGGMIPSQGNALSDVFLNWTPRLKLEFAPLGDINNRLWLGASVSYYALCAQNGWDRYNSLDPNEDFVLAHVFPVRIYGIYFLEDNTDFGLTVGVQLQPSSITEDGQDAGVETGTGFYVGFSNRF